MLRRPFTGFFPLSSSSACNAVRSAVASTAATATTCLSCSSSTVLVTASLCGLNRQFSSFSSPTKSLLARKMANPPPKSSSAQQQEGEQGEGEEESPASSKKKGGTMSASRKQQAQRKKSKEEAAAAARQQAAAREQQQNGAENNNEEEGDDDGPELSDETAMVRRGNDIPTTGTVEEYSRVARARENRLEVIEAAIWEENSTYAPILSRGKQNVYEHTDDIPRDIKPMFGDTQIWQTREYFEFRRNAETTRFKVMYLGSGIFFFLALALGVAFTRIWIDQPSEVVLLRRSLLASSYGRVCELAAGQGLNIGVYPFAVTDVVLVDQNPQELHILRSRLPRTAYPTYQVVCDKAEELKAFPDHCFDTVVDMFGLCHYKDPVLVLQQMQRICKPTGTILLLEHGRSDWTVVNWFLDFKANDHYEKTQGCQWNRDIRKYMKDAGLVVRSLETEHYGTTHIIVAHPAIDQESPLTVGGKVIPPVHASGGGASPITAAASA